MGGEEKEDNLKGVKGNKRQHKEVAIFGNYYHYYGYRIGRGEEDPRLKAMKKEWFEGKNCLDIGCNSGVFTIAIAQKFGCRSILGIDIDRAQVEEANKELAKSLNGSTRADSGESQESGRRDLFDVVSFKKANFILHWNPPKDTRYDTIMCLSVSKWVHLNWGDDGLIDLFVKAWRLLKPGGVFILEPQPWSSYLKKRLVSETTRLNFQYIKIRPEDFKEILLDKIGFRRVEDRTSKASGQKTGFKRPIFAFLK